VETILIVDDDPQVLAIVGKMLEGYGLLKAANAEEAVRVASSHVGPTHLFLTDVVMRDVLATKPASPFDRPPDPWRNVSVVFLRG
jgi:CheY-like chemotaxis protein